MKFSKREPEPATMQLAPMIDIVFLLLIFFIVTWQYSRSETELSVAVPSSQEGVQKDRMPGEAIINILEDGTVRFEGNAVTLPELQSKLHNIAQKYKDQPVRVRGDGRVSYQHIVGVIDTCQKAGIWNISFATQRPKEKP